MGWMLVAMHTEFGISKTGFGVPCKVVLRQNLPQYPTSTPCPKLRLCLPLTRLTAVEMAVKQRIHYVLEWEKQRSPSPSLGAAQPQGIGDSWDQPQLFYLIKSPPNHPTQASWEAGSARVTQGNAGAEPGDPRVSHHTVLGREK